MGELVKYDDGFIPDMRLNIGEVDGKFPGILRENPTLACLAAFIPSTGVMGVFLKCPCDWALGDDRGRTIAHFACAGGDAVLCAELCELGVRFDTPDREGRTPGYYAAVMNRLGVLCWLVTNGLLTGSLEQWKREVEPGVLLCAAESGYAHVVQTLLGQGVGLCRDNDLFRDDRTTALHLAAKGGHETAVRVLLGFGGGFLRRDERGHTPIMYAIAAGSPACVRALWEAAVPEKKGEQHPFLFVFNEATDLLSHVARRGYADVLRCLFEKGVTLSEDERATALDLAAEAGRENVSRLLREDRGSPAAIISAIESGNLSLVQELWRTAVPRRRAVHPYLVKLNGAKDAMFRIVRLGHADVLCFLLDQGVALPDDERTTALHLAAEVGRENVIRVLLDHGCSVSRCDARRRTPLMCAVDSGSLLCVRLLWERGANVEGPAALRLVRRAGRRGDLCVMHYLEEQAGLHGLWTAADGAVYVLNSDPSGGVLVSPEATEVLVPLSVTKIDSKTVRVLTRLRRLTIHTAVDQFASCAFDDCPLKHLTIIDSFKATSETIALSYTFVKWCSEHGVEKFDGEPPALCDIRAAQLKLGDFVPILPPELVIDGRRDVPIMKFTGSEIVSLLFRAPAAAKELADIAALEVEPIFDLGEEEEHQVRHRAEGGEPAHVMNEVREAIRYGDAERLARIEEPVNSHCLADGAVEGGVADVVRVLVEKSERLRGRVCEAIVRQGRLTDLLDEFLTEELLPGVFMSALLGGNAEGLTAVLRFAGSLGEIHPPLGFEVAVCFADNADALDALDADVDEALIVKFDAWRCARRAGLGPKELLDFAVLRRAVYIIAHWLHSKAIAPDAVIEAGLRFGNAAVVSLAIDAGASVDQGMVDACADARIKRMLAAAIPVAESPLMTEEVERAKLRVAESDRRDNIDKPWADEARQIWSMGFRDLVEPAALAGTFCASDEFSFKGNHFLLFLTQSGRVLQHWFPGSVTKLAFQEAMLGLLLRLLAEMEEVTIIHDNAFRFGAKLVRFCAEHGVVIVPLPPNSNDLNGQLEALIERIIAHLLKQVDQLNVPGLMASFVMNHRFPRLFEDFWMSASAVAFAAGGATVPMLSNGVFRGDLHATKRASRQITPEEERVIHLCLTMQLPQWEVAALLGLFQQTLQSIVARDECGHRSVCLKLDDAEVLSIFQTVDGPAVCFTPGLGRVDNVRACDILWHRGAVQKCVAHLEEHGFAGTVLGRCGDNAVVAFGPFEVEVPIVFLSIARQGQLLDMPEDGTRHLVSVVSPERFIFGRREPLPKWTVPVVTGDGKSLVYRLVKRVATFTRRGPPATLRLDGPGGSMIANFCGNRPGASGLRSFKALGDLYLLSLPTGGIFLEAAASGKCPATVAELQSMAAQVGRSWLKDPGLRHVTWALIANWATNREYHNVHELAVDAGVDDRTVEKYLQRALAVGLPLVRGLDVDDKSDWMDARRRCVRRLLRDGSFPGWGERMVRLDEIKGTIPQTAERRQFMWVAQALLSLRQRGLGESHVPVRDELVAGRVPLRLGDEELEAIIADVRLRLAISEHRVP